jgi:hypothetical protein
LEKGSYLDCDKICDTGCSMYADRPESCSKFECLWLRGMLGDEDEPDTRKRPDSCGVMFDYQRDTKFGEVFKAYELEPGSSDWMRAKNIINRLKKRFLVIIFTHDGGRDPNTGHATGKRRIVGPPRLVTHAAEVLRKVKMGHAG